MLTSHKSRKPLYLARNVVAPDPWAMSRLRWVSKWIKSHGLDEPTAEDVRAGLEYLPEQNAA